MKVGLLVIASEVLDGKITDLNTRILTEFLRKHNLELNFSMTVRDTEEAIHLGLHNLFEKNDLVVTTGGLGPTQDDITKQTLATFLGRTISYSAEAENVASQNYQKFERAFPGKEHGYSYLPMGFVPLPNSAGFAPGLFAQHFDKFIFCAPGVPKEFRSMLEDHLIGLIMTRLPKSFMDNVIIRTKKVPEEKIFGEVDKTLWDKLAKFGDVSSLPVLFGVDIGVKLKAETSEELLGMKNEILNIVKASPVNESVWHIGPESVEEVIVEVAGEKKVKFGFAESCTGGLCSHRITGVSGSGNSFIGSVVSYDVSVKANQLNVKKETLAEFGAVSIETAKEMASGLLRNLGLDVAISITGFAGPSGGTPEKPVGTVCIGVATKDHVDASRYRFYGDREQLKNRFSQAALMTLLETLEKIA